MESPQSEYQLLPIELLAEILQHLDLASLARSSRVNKTWYHLINDYSKSLKDPKILAGIQKILQRHLTNHQLPLNANDTHSLITIAKQLEAQTHSVNRMLGTTKDIIKFQFNIYTLANIFVKTFTDVVDAFRQKYQPYFAHYTPSQLAIRLLAILLVAATLIYSIKKGLGRDASFINELLLSPTHFINAYSKLALKVLPIFIVLNFAYKLYENYYQAQAGYEQRLVATVQQPTVNQNRREITAPTHQYLTMAWRRDSIFISQRCDFKEFKSDGEGQNLRP